MCVEIARDILSYFSIYLIFSWFEPFIMMWLDENDDLSMDYLYNAIDKDKNEGVSFIFLIKNKDI